MAEEGYVEKGKTKVAELVEQVIPLPSSDPAEHKAVSKSTQKKEKLKVLVATLVVEGNPLLKVNEVVTIENVAKRHGGNWLVEKVTHNIPAGGTYTCTLELSKDATNKKTNSGATKKADNSNKSRGTDKAETKKKVAVVYVNTEGTGKETKVYK